MNMHNTTYMSRLKFSQRFVGISWKAVFSNPRPSVTHFKLTCSDQVFSLRALGHVACIMGSKSSQCGQFTREGTHAVQWTSSTDCVYGKLANKAFASTLQTKRRYTIIIENQKNLHTLNIRTRPTRMGSVATPEYDQLIRCVGNLFSKHTFHRLGLYDFSFSHSSGQHVRVSMKSCSISCAACKRARIRAEHTI